MPKAESIGNHCGASESRLRVSPPARSDPRAEDSKTRNADALLDLDWAAHPVKRTAKRVHSRRVLGPALATIELDGTVSSWNRAAERMFGRAAPSVLGQPLSSLLHAQLESLRFFADPPDGHETAELDGSFRRTDGSARAVIMQLEPLRDETGLLVAIEVRLRNPSRSGERASRDLDVERFRAMTDAAAGIAHDTNNMLMVVQSYIEFVTAGPLSLTQRDDLKLAADAARRGGLLTKQMLELCRRRGVAPLACELNETVRNFWELLRGALSGGVRLELSVLQAPLWIQCAPGQVDRVLLNLVLNARDAMPNGGTITVGLERTVVQADDRRYGALPPGSYARLTVTDTGDGVPEDLIERIFEPRFTTKSEGRGSGLGLAVVREAVSALGGGLRLESELGRGSTFSICIPLASSAESADERVDCATPATMPDWISVARQAFAPRAAQVEPRRRAIVLVVDDDVPLRDSLVRVLLEADLDARGVTDGVSALDILAQGDIDVVIAEQFMAGMDGTSFFALAYERFPSISRILFTARASADVILAAVNRGHVDKVLLKNMHAVAIRDEVTVVALNALRRKRVAGLPGARPTGRPPRRTDFCSE